MTKYSNRICHSNASVFDVLIIVITLLLLVSCQVVRGAFAVRYTSTHSSSSSSTITNDCSKGTRHYHQLALSSLSVVSNTALLLQKNKQNSYKTIGMQQRYKYRTRYHDTSGSAGLSVRGGSAVSVTATTSSTAAVANVDDSSSSSTSNNKNKNNNFVYNDKDALQLLPKSMPSLPTLQQYRKFAIPCLALWVAGPLLSLVDTTFVGLSGSPSQSSQQLAALGPATTFFDGATYLFQFLNVATTNLYSSARAANGDQSDQAEAVVTTSARVAIRCGVGLMIFLFAFTRPLLKLYIGNKAIQTPGLLNSACDYVYIRALSMPTSLLLGVLQASLLGSKDSVTPLVAILYSTVVNFFGDYLLVSVFKYGLQGAAIATTLAQWAGTAALIPAARKKLVRDGNLGIITKSTVTEHSVSSKAFLSFAAPVLTLILGKLAAFGFMTHSAAAVPGQPIPLASHQIILSLLFFCSPFFEVLSQTAQTFLPPFLAPIKAYVTKMKQVNKSYNVNQDKNLIQWINGGQKVATNLLGIGFVSAAVVASAASLVPAFAGYLITSDPITQIAVKPLAIYLWLGAFFWAPVAVSEGVLLARLELKFLALVYLISIAFLPSALLKIKYNPTGTVAQVWSCFVIFQMFRAITFMGRIWGDFAIQNYKRISTTTKTQSSSATKSRGGGGGGDNSSINMTVDNNPAIDIDSTSLLDNTTAERALDTGYSIAASLISSSDDSLTTTPASVNDVQQSSIGIDPLLSDPTTNFGS